MVYENLKYRIGITLIKGVGNAIAKNLITYLGSEEAVFKETKKNLSKISGIGPVLSEEIVKQDVLRRAEEEIEFIEKKNITPLFYTEKAYPYRLKECPDSPIMLFTKGNCDLNAGKFVAVVGTRKVTEYGKENCQKLIATLAAQLPQTVIVSGLAFGVDICAHKAALDNGLSTIAVLAHGLDRIYPGIHRPTAVKMLETGMIMTEYLSKTIPEQQNFLQRNRIIAGLCDATIVMESATAGGSISTATMANDYNRDVFAFPGRVGDERSSGCNILIKSNKASLIENADDLLKFMSWDRIASPENKNYQTSLFVDLTPDEQEIVNILRKSPDGLQANDIATVTAKPINKVSPLLLEMEFKGLLKCLPGNLYRIVK
ncbi:MAG: DNA-processing protein DprA [Paludibacter sp.]|jgi:DNA processing protein|nr:DNA-processing protein DprA [Paludibacter sp.]